MKHILWVIAASLCGAVPAGAQEPVPAPPAAEQAPGATPAPAPAPPKPTVEELLRRIEELSREVEELKRKEAEREKMPAPAAAPPAAPPRQEPTVAQPRIPQVREPTAEVYGYLQSQFETTSVDGHRFLVRRARVGVRGNLEHAFRYYITAEVTSGEPLRDAVIQWDGWKKHHVRFGQFVVPFSFEGFESSARLPAIERTYIVDAIYDNREVGIGLFSEEDPERILGYGVALVNGAGRNEFEASERNVGIGRIQLRTPRSKPVLGGQLSVGFSTKQGHAYNVNRDRPEDEAYGVDLTFTRGPWLARGEWLRGRFDNLIREGYYGLLVYRLSPRWEFLGRYEGYNEDPGPVGAHRTTLGANYYFSRSTRMMLDYEFVDGRPPFDAAGSSVGVSGLRLRLQTIF